MIDIHEDESQEFKNIINKIIIDAQSGLKDFYERYGKAIEATAKRVTKSVTLAQEVSNEVLFKIWKNSKKLLNIKNPRSWIYVVVKNYSLDLLKRDKKHQKLDDNIPAQENQLQQYIEKSEFFTRISPLSEVEQEILEKKILWKFTFQEISADKKLPISTISATYYRAIKKLSEKTEKN